MLTLSAGAPDTLARALASLVSALAGPGELASALSSPDAARWAITLTDSRAPAFAFAPWPIVEAQPAGTPSDAPLAPTEASLTLEFDANAIRSACPEAFSREPAGRLLDALGLDNARRVWVVLRPDDGHSAELRIEWESRADPPGVRRSQTLARITSAADAADPSWRADVDLAGGWTALAQTILDVALVNDPARREASAFARRRAWERAHGTSLARLVLALESGPLIIVGDGPRLHAAVIPLRDAARPERLIADGRATAPRNFTWIGPADMSGQGAIALGRESGSVTLHIAIRESRASTHLVFWSDQEPTPAMLERALAESRP